MEQVISNIKYSKYKNFYIHNKVYWKIQFKEFIIFKGINCNFCGNFFRLQNLNIKNYPENIYCKCFINEWYANYKDIHNHYFQKVIKEYIHLIKSRKNLIKYSTFYNKYHYKKDENVDENVDEDKENFMLTKQISLSTITSVSSFDSELSLETSSHESEYDSNIDFKLNIILNSLIDNSVEEFFKKKS